MFIFAIFTVLVLLILLGVYLATKALEPCCDDCANGTPCSGAAKPIEPLRIKPGQIIGNTGVISKIQSTKS